MYVYGYEKQDHGDDCVTFVVTELYAPEFSDYRREEYVASFATETEAREMVAALYASHEA
jgi:hypothetical protein